MIMLYNRMEEMFKQILSIDEINIPILSISITRLLKFIWHCFFRANHVLFPKSKKMFLTCKQLTPSSMIEFLLCNNTDNYIYNSAIDFLHVKNQLCKRLLKLFPKI